MGFRFLHIADCHLGSPLKGLASRDGALAALFDRAVWRAFENAVDLAIEEKVAFVLIAGDVFDGDWRDYATGQAFVRTIARLPRAGIRVAMIRGNHDAASIMTRHLPLPEGVAWLSEDQPETLDWPDLGVAVHGRGFKDRSVSESMVQRYPPPLAGRFNIGMLHTSLDGRPGVDRYAPASLADLERMGYDYWALGHVHQREVVRVAAPTVVFPGNIQSRSVRETGEKTVTLVDVEGTRVCLDHRAVDQARFAVATIDVGGVTMRDEAETRIRQAVGSEFAAAGGRPLAVRLRLTGETPIADELVAGREALRQELQAQLAALGDSIAVEKVVVETVPLGHRSPGLPGVDLSDVLDAVRTSGALKAGAAADTMTVRGKLPQNKAGDPDPLATDEAILAAAEALVLARLGGKA